MARHAKRAKDCARPGAKPDKSKLLERIVYHSPDELKPFAKNPRKHPEAQIVALMKNIKRRWTSPILIDENKTVLAGHGRLEAARRLGLLEVPTIQLQGLTEAEKTNIVISDNRLPEKAVWDIPLLSDNFKHLLEIDFDVELSGFTTGEIDIFLDSTRQAEQGPEDVVGALPSITVSRTGDCWHLGRHKLLCGSALDPIAYSALMADERAQLVVTDPPYNVRINGHARGRGSKQHREFAMASGEMTEPQFASFLEGTAKNVISHSQDGSMQYWFIDWRHCRVMQQALDPLYSELKNLLVWNKSNAGQGSLYRSKHELVAVYKLGEAPHINNIALGVHGRYRTNVLDYPGGASPNGSRREELDIHPTVKPVALIADLIRDCSRRNGIVLDPFAGSGTIFLAAERTGRVARAIEIDPLYVDLAISRWEKMAGRHAVHAVTRKLFKEVQTERIAALKAANSQN